MVEKPVWGCVFDEQIEEEDMVLGGKWVASRGM